MDFSARSRPEPDAGLSDRKRRDQKTANEAHFGIRGRSRNHTSKAASKRRSRTLGSPDRGDQQPAATASETPATGDHAAREQGCDTRSKARSEARSQTVVIHPAASSSAAFVGMSRTMSSRSAGGSRKRQESRTARAGLSQARAEGAMRRRSGGGERGKCARRASRRASCAAGQPPPPTEMWKAARGWSRSRPLRSMLQATTPRARNRSEDIFAIERANAKYRSSRAG